MKIYLALLLIFCLHTQLPAQEKLPAFGKPDAAELDMKECAFEKSANALKLIDEEEKEIIAEYGLKVKTMHRVRIKIFSEKGFSAASVKIPYYSRTRGSKITDLDAYIYFRDSLGKINTEKVENDEIFKSKSGKNYTYLRFTFPHLKAGCVIEYRYYKKEKEILDLSPWYFQDEIPTRYSAFTILGPANIPIIKRLFGMDSVTEFVKYDRGSVDGRRYFEKTYLQKDISSFHPEAMMTYVADNLKRIEFVLQPRGFGFSTILFKSEWAAFAEILGQITYFGKQFDKAIPGTEALVDSVRKLTTREDKIQFILRRVKEQIKWNKQQTFYTGDLTEIWKEKTGNSGDINMAIMNLLRRSGVKAYPLLISTRENGKTDPEFISLGQFNGLDILAPDSLETYVLDGTRNQPFSVPPSNILNRSVFIADTAYAQWIEVSDKRPLLKSLINITADLLPDGKIKGNAASFFYDHSKELRLEQQKKNQEEEKEDRDKEEEKEFLKKDFTSLTTDSVQISDAEDDLKPLTEQFNFTYEPSSSGDFLFVDPFFLSNFRKNPFSDSLRLYPIDFGGRQYLKTSLMINIPEEYEIDFLPANIRMRMADSSILFERVIHKLEGKIYFTNKMEVLYPLFDKEEYPNLQQFFSKMYTLLTEQIILKRKK
ncbi:MAG: DUF3857 domain-containing protein [Bacteroidetes bacterium]|nr:DUF3857 domain-containing protein [Bacteroidota bacterium]